MILVPIFLILWLGKDVESLVCSVIHHYFYFLFFFALSSSRLGKRWWERWFINPWFHHELWIICWFMFILLCWIQSWKWLMLFVERCISGYRRGLHQPLYLNRLLVYIKFHHSLTPLKPGFFFFFFFLKSPSDRQTWLLYFFLKNKKKKEKKVATRIDSVYVIDGWTAEFFWRWV